MTDGTSVVQDKTSVEVVDKPKIPLSVDFAAGTFAGIAALLVGYPLDTVKVRLQSSETSRRYAGAGIARILTTIVREEGVRGMYKGVVSPMAATAFMNGLKRAEQEPTLGQIVLAGAGSGIACSILTGPTELVKIRQQLAVNHQPSTLKVIRQIIRCLARHGYGAYFATYEGMCRLLRPTNGNGKDVADHASLASEVEHEIGTLSVPRLLIAGGTAGVAGWATTFAFDVIKTRCQGAEGQFLGIWKVARDAYRTGGARVFFVGLWPTIVRAIPVNMVTFGAFELGVHVLTSL
ncbi:mitochondrial carrier [Auriculariales sp. MPI-PUGE-AT-0066]|nr:mitochondrial carrier [Auriculariales sp. MPI-PUGE-AT-0066]